MGRLFLLMKFRWLGHHFQVVGEHGQLQLCAGKGVVGTKSCVCVCVCCLLLSDPEV